MSYIVVAVATFFFSALTLFSGFGLGTLLLPVFAFFFPVEVAVAATAVVHMANNLLKFQLFYGKSDWAIARRFGMPAVVTAFVGALLLGYLSGIEPLGVYSVGTKEAVVTPVKLVIAIVIFAFALVELLPRFSKLKFDSKYMPIGGALSGFFGGLSGHQGAFRSAFLAKSGLTPEAFIGTSTVIAVMVDLARLLVYGVTFFTGQVTLVGGFGGWSLVITAILAAFAGVLVGKRFIKKVTIRSIQILAGSLMVLVAFGLGSGLI